jgi:hypothetical protein
MGEQKRKSRIGYHFLFVGLATAIGMGVGEAQFDCDPSYYECDLGAVYAIGGAIYGFFAGIVLSLLFELGMLIRWWVKD